MTIATANSGSSGVSGDMALTTGESAGAFTVETATRLAARGVRFP